MKRAPNMPELFPAAHAPVEAPAGPTFNERQLAGEFDDWTTYEKRYAATFVAWAGDPFRHTNGARYRYAVVRRTPCPGLGWVLLVFVIPLPGSVPERVMESQGAFYDGADDHPEGAVAWATAGAREEQRRQFGAVQVDEGWARILESLGYGKAESVRLATRPLSSQSVPGLAEKLRAIRVLWCDTNGTMGLWGIPHPMLDGRQPSAIKRAQREQYENLTRPGGYGSKPIDLSDWLWLGSPGWWGSYNKEDVARIKAFLAQPHVAPCIPEHPGEWCPLDEPEPPCPT